MRSLKRPRQVTLCVRPLGCNAMFRSLRRISIAIVLALPGVGLAFCAKPLGLRETGLFLGLALAFLVPALWLVTERPQRNSK
jgi:hypothetical protein